MDRRQNRQTLDERAANHAARVRQILHGQHGPQASGG